MPIYEYQCDQCGVFEQIQRITEDPLKKCPTCKGKVRRLISSTSFMLKGTGWYATDYGHAKASSGSESTSANGKSGESGTSTASADKGSADKSSTSSDKSSASSDKSSGSDKAASSS
jgi:putative FmdB family regulatory protein